MGRDILFVLVMVVTVALLAGTLGYAIYLGVIARGSRTGRIVFGSMATLKLWVVTVLVYLVLVPVVFPGRLTRGNREVINWLLLLYLLGQALGSLIALERFRRYGEPQES